jgi:hypothetical protein
MERACSKLKNENQAHQSKQTQLKLFFRYAEILVYIDNYLNYLPQSKIQCGYAYEYLEARS